MLSSDRKRREAPRKLFHATEKTESDGCTNCKEVKIFQVEKPVVKLKSKPIQSKPSPKRNFKCPLCGGMHPLFRCPTLLKEKAKDRFRMVKDMSLCIQCLGKHEKDKCSFKPCPYCGKEHNLVLCFKKEQDRENKKDDWNKPSSSKNY